MSKPLILQLEDRKRELAEAAMLLPPNSMDKFYRMTGEYAGLDYVVELIKSLEKDDD